MGNARECFHSSSRPGMYNKLTSNMTGLLGATRGLPGVEVSPLGNANCSDREKENHHILSRSPVYEETMPDHRRKGEVVYAKQLILSCFLHYFLKFGDMR